MELFIVANEDVVKEYEPELVLDRENVLADDGDVDEPNWSK